MPEKPSLIFALISFLPVAFAAIGLLALAKMLSRKSEVVGELGYIGCFLIFAGNLLSAIGNLIYATTGNEAAWMKNGLLFLSAPGFVCLAWALWRAFRSDLNKLTAGAVWLLPLFFNGGLLALTAALKMVIGGQAWLKLLLTVVTVSSVFVFAQLALAALKSQKQFVAVLFILSLGMSLAISLRANDGTLAEAWAQQVSKIVFQAIFAYASLQIGKLARLAAKKP
jgi:hypothetical protein